MSDILIQNIPSQGVTTISNQFLDQYMPQANGEFVKVYLYLLRATQSAQTFSLSAIADHFDCTERDVMRALRYWEKAGILKLTLESRKLTSISFCPLSAPTMTASVPQEAVLSQPETMSNTPVNMDIPEVTEPEPSAPVSTPVRKIPAKKALTASEKKELREKEDVCQFLFIAEQYLGRTLSKTDMDNLLYFYSQLHFSADLIEYLLEYCVSKGSRSARYIETVALAWAEDGITSVQEAKESTSLHNKNYFSILKAMGIKSRNPVKMEQTFMDNWLQELGFSMDIILEACQRTVIQTGQASFPYADSILKGWSKSGVRHLTDIPALDEKHKKRAAKSSKETSVQPKPGKAEYPHRTYDYEEIKKSLFKQ